MDSLTLTTRFCPNSLRLTSRGRSSKRATLGRNTTYGAEAVGVESLIAAKASENVIKTATTNKLKLPSASLRTSLAVQPLLTFVPAAITVEAAVDRDAGLRGTLDVVRVLVLAEVYQCSAVWTSEAVEAAALRAIFVQLAPVAARHVRDCPVQCQGHHQQRKRRACASPWKSHRLGVVEKRKTPKTQGGHSSMKPNQGAEEQCDNLLPTCKAKRMNIVSYSYFSSPNILLIKFYRSISYSSYSKF